MPDIESLYRKKNGKVLIEIRITTIMQLFNSFDPSPFHERELDHDAEHYIVDAVRDFPAKTQFSIVIHVPKGCSKTAECLMIPDAIRNHFRYRVISEERRFRQRFRYGRINLVLSLVFLAFSLFISKAILRFGDGFLVLFISEAFTIAGWVALWAPVTLLLYELWPIIETKRVYERISAMDIEILPV